MKKVLFTLIFVFELFLSGVNAQANANDESTLVPYPCDSLWELPKGIKPVVAFDPNMAVIFFEALSYELYIHVGDTCTGEALVIKQGQKVLEYRFANQKMFYQYVVEDGDFVYLNFYHYPPQTEKR